MIHRLINENKINERIYYKTNSSLYEEEDYHNIFLKNIENMKFIPKKYINRYIIEKLIDKNKIKKFINKNENENKFEFDDEEI